MEGMIDVSDINLASLIGAAYARSRPQGMGHYHFQPGPLPQEELEKILAHRRFNTERQKGSVSMDYVLGRAVKLTVHLVGDGADAKRFIPARWFDHSDHDLISLLVGCGLSGEDAESRIAAGRGDEKVC